MPLVPQKEKKRYHKWHLLVIFEGETYHTMLKQPETDNMKHVIHTTTVLLLALFISFSANAQSGLKKANKEFELYAFNLAVKSYRKVLEKEPNNAEALARMGDCYRHLNQMGEAAQWYVKALEQEGVDPVNLFYFGEVLKAMGEYEKAKVYFEIYAEGQPYFGEHFAASCDFAQSMKGISTVYRVKKEFVNTTSSDFGPAFFKDQVVFSSSRSDIPRADVGKGETWTGDAKNQLFISSTDKNGYLTIPKFLRSDLSNQYNEGPLSFSGDGTIVAFTKNDFVDGTRQIPSSGMELSIYIAEVNSNGDFREAKAFPYNGSGYSSGFPSLSADGKTMYFSSNRPDGLGGWDIYVSRRIGETWTTPENLGAVVNTAGNEISPFFLGNSLFFSSDWHHGFGGLDIFRAERNDNEWNKVYHLGNGINSPRDDYGLIFSADKNIGYFTSNRSGGKGREDIYQFSKRTDQILITVSDAEGQPVPGASVDFSACNESVFITDEGGNYAFQALGGLDCETIISKVGYTSFALKVESSGARKNQSYKVVLTKEAEKLTGMLVSTATNLAVSDVFVRATDQGTGEILEDYSDSNGRYALPLQKNSIYVIRYSKAGYTDTHNRISVGDGSDKSVLGVLPFTPSTTSIGSTTSPTGSSTNSDTESETVVLNSEGYAIQLAAVYGSEKLNTSSFKGLRSIGNLYTRPEKGYTKLRLGIFETKAEADAAKVEIQAKGYTQVFVVPEKLENMDEVKVYDFPAEEPVLASNTTTPKTESVPVEESTPAPPKPEKTTPEKPATTPVSNAVDNGQYKIRLITYSTKNVKFFDPSKIESLGTIEQQEQGQYTIMLLSSFNTLQAADQAYEEVKRKGFTGAHIITEKGGKWVRVK